MSASEGKWPQTNLKRTLAVSTLVLYREGLTTCPIQVLGSPGRTDVVIPFGACQEDFELALAVVNQIGGDSTAAIEILGERRVTREEFRTSMDAAWVRRQLGLLETVLPDFLRNQTQARSEPFLICLWGPFYDFTIGPELLSELELAGDGFAERLFERMRLLNYGFRAEHPEVRTHWLEDGAELLPVAVWDPGASCMFNGAEVFLVALPAGHPSGISDVILSRADALRLAPAGHGLDEVHIPVDPVSEGDRDAFFADALAANNPGLLPTKGPEGARQRRARVGRSTPWWKFWA